MDCPEFILKSDSSFLYMENLLNHKDDIGYENRIGCVGFSGINGFDKNRIHITTVPLKLTNRSLKSLK